MSRTTETRPLRVPVGSGTPAVLRLDECQAGDEVVLYGTVTSVTTTNGRSQVLLLLPGVGESGRWAMPGSVKIELAAIRREVGMVDDE